MTQIVFEDIACLTSINSLYLSCNPPSHHDLRPGRVSASKLEQTIDQEPRGQETSDGNQGVLLELPDQFLIRGFLVSLAGISVHLQLFVELKGFGINLFFLLNNLVFSVSPRSIQTRLFSILLSFRASLPAFLETFS